MKKVLSLSLILVLCVVILTGCNYDGKITQENAPEPKPTSTSTPTSNSDPTIEEDLAYPMQFTDDRGNVTTFEKEPERVISLSPNITEVIYALGQGEKLVGRTVFCDYPQDVQPLSLGDLSSGILKQFFAGTRCCFCFIAEHRRE